MEAIAIAETTQSTKNSKLYRGFNLYSLGCAICPTLGLFQDEATKHGEESQKREKKLGAGSSLGVNAMTPLAAGKAQPERLLLDQG